MPDEVGYSFTVDGKLVPAREWSLYRSRNDAIETSLRDNLRGGVTQYTVNRFAGGDAARLTLSPHLRAASPVRVGDTLASIYSNEIARQYAALGGQLQVALASLDLHSTGEKTPVVEEERMRLTQAEEQRRQHLVELSRLRRLRGEGLISEQELELAESQQKVLEAGVEVARARVEAVQSGAKPEQIEFTRAGVRSLREEIEAVVERLRLSTITSPIAGRVSRSFGSDTLLAVYDTTAFVAMMVVPLQKHGLMSVGDSVEVSISGLGEPLRATVEQLGEEIHVLSGEQVVIVSAVVGQPRRTLLPGAVVICRVNVGRVPLMEYLRQVFSTSA